MASKAKSGLSAVRQFPESVLSPPNSFLVGALSFTSAIRDGKGHSEYHVGVVNDTPFTLQVQHAWLSAGLFTEDQTVPSVVDPVTGMSIAEIIAPVTKRFIKVFIDAPAPGLGAAFEAGIYFQPRASGPVLVSGPGGGGGGGGGNRGSFATNQQDVAVPLTAEQLQDQPVPNGFSIVVIAKSSNTGLIFLGNSKANAENHAVSDILAAGSFRRLFITNANLVWIDAAVGGEGVTWIVET